MVSLVVTVESVDSVFVSSAETLLSFKTTELPKIKLATRTAPAFSHFDDFLMAYHSCVYLVCLYVIC